jgi:hypothetical protein
MHHPSQALAIERQRPGVGGASGGRCRRAAGGWQRWGLTLALAAFAWPALVAQGAIEWPQKTIELSTSFKQQDVKAGFVFRNTGDRPVTITSVNSNCDCTTAELEKKTYAPGEEGKINVMFEIGDYMGIHDAHILVTTDTPSVPPTDLILRVHIPEYLKLEPHMAVWHIRGEPEEKTLVCAAVAHESVWLTEAHSSESTIAARIETIEAGRKYLVHLRPASTANHVVATIQMRVDVEGVGTRILNAYAYVTGP